MNLIINQHQEVFSKLIEATVGAAAFSAGSLLISVGDNLIKNAFTQTHQVFKGLWSGSKNYDQSVMRDISKGVIRENYEEGLYEKRKFDNLNQILDKAEEENTLGKYMTKAGTFIQSGGIGILTGTVLRSIYQALRYLRGN